MAMATEVQKVGRSEFFVSLRSQHLAGSEKKWVTSDARNCVLSLDLSR